MHGARRLNTHWLTAAILALALLAAAAQAAHAGGAGHKPVPLLSQTPIQTVSAAAVEARHQAPVPTALNPGSASLDASELAANCLPKFGSGLSFGICTLGAVRAHHLVVILGDSHASMWIPGLVGAAKRLDFRLVPIAKPGCALWALHENRTGWPCLSWWREARAIVRRLHPSATVVSFMTGNFKVAQASHAADTLEWVLKAVPHPVLLVDPPSDEWYVNTVPSPAQCMSSPGANLGRCALHVTATLRALLTQIQAMVNRDGFPAIPTLQWFCADTICPTVIDDTVTSEDGNHVTPQYAQLLAPRLAGRLRPILRQLWRAEAATRAVT